MNIFMLQDLGMPLATALPSKPAQGDLSTRMPETPLTLQEELSQDTDFLDVFQEILSDNLPELAPNDPVPPVADPVPEETPIATTLPNALENAVSIPAIPPDKASVPTFDTAIASPAALMPQDPLLIAPSIATDFPKAVRLPQPVEFGEQRPPLTPSVSIDEAVMPASVTSVEVAFDKSRLSPASLALQRQVDAVTAPILTRKSAPEGPTASELDRVITQEQSAQRVQQQIAEPIALKRAVDKRQDAGEPLQKPTAPGAALEILPVAKQQTFEQARSVILEQKRSLTSPNVELVDKPAVVAVTREQPAPVEKQVPTQVKSEFQMMALAKKRGDINLRPTEVPVPLEKRAPKPEGKADRTAPTLTAAAPRPIPPLPAETKVVSAAPIGQVPKVEGAKVARPVESVFQPESKMVLPIHQEQRAAVEVPPRAPLTASPPADLVARDMPNTLRSLSMEVRPAAPMVEGEPQKTRVSAADVDGRVATNSAMVSPIPEKLQERMAAALPAARPIQSVQHGKRIVVAERDPPPSADRVEPKVTHDLPSLKPASPPLSPPVHLAAGLTKSLSVQTVEKTVKTSMVAAPEAVAGLVLETSSPSAPQPPTAVQRTDLPTHIARQIADVAQQMPNRPVDISLNPEELGRVRLSMTAQDAGLMVVILAERPETLDIMKRHISTLGQEFQAMGYEDVSFSFAGGDQGMTQSDAADPEERLGSGDATAHADEIEEPKRDITRSPLTSTDRGLDIRV
ncbi:MAG: flagellar hook-length control protein FliK [Pseudomonadota bacterium]